jgi:tRNA (guanine37-N1)-methyltransferase
VSGPQLTFEVLTLFPAAVRAFASAGLLGRAIERGKVALETTDFRDFTDDRHRTVDDAPFGGGAGMVIKPEPVVAALEHVIATRGPMHRILLTPSAPRFDQRIAERLATLPRVALLCGRYEGIDDRVREHYVDECLSIGDFVLGGGEVAALVVIEAVARLVDGVVGNPESVQDDSFGDTGGGALLEFPQYTRPAVFRGHAVPAVLQGGDHAAIRAWRLQASIDRTWEHRPELRPQHAWPRELPIHIAVGPRAPQGDEEIAWRTALESSDIAGVVVIGGDEDAALAWTRALGGRVQVTAFADARALVRRFRSRGGAPWWVRVVEAAAPGVVQHPPALLDRLRTCAGHPAGGPGHPAGGRGHQRGAVVLIAPGAAAPTDAPADATFAPTRATEHETALAPASVIVDPSPPAGPAVWVRRAIATLRGQ